MAITELPGRRGARRFLPLAMIAVAAVLGFVFLRDTLSFETLADHHEALRAWRDAHYWPAVALYVAGYVAVVALSLPGALPMTLVGGFLFGLFPGVLYIVTAATIGAAAIFLAARLGLGELLEARMSGNGAFARIAAGIRENELPFLFLIRLVPVVPFFAANLVPALLGVSFRNFLVSTFFGIMPGSAVYTWIGAGLSRVFEEGGKPSLGIIWESYVLGPLLGLAALAALPILLRSRSGDRRP